MQIYEPPKISILKIYEEDVLTSSPGFDDEGTVEDGYDWLTFEP